MPWHTSALVIEGDHEERAAELLADLGFPALKRGPQITGDEAGESSLPGRAVGVVNGWTFVWDPLMFAPNHPSEPFEDGIWSRQLDQTLARMSRQGRVYSFHSEGASDTHGFAWYAKGALRRSWLWRHGEVAFEKGAILPEEQAAVAEDPDEEGRLFVLMEKLTGVSLDDVFSHRFTVFA
jgi:hypothetical protein